MALLIIACVAVLGLVYFVFIQGYSATVTTLLMIVVIVAALWIGIRVMKDINKP